MEGFQKFVLYAAIIILIITLVVIGVALSKAHSNVLWPPMTPACPDYWTIDGSGNNAVCVNVKGLGSCTTPTEGHKFYTKNFNINISFILIEAYSISYFKINCSFIQRENNRIVL